MDWMLMPLRRYAEFSGRSRRKEYWLFVLFQLLVSAVIGAVFGRTTYTGAEGMMTGAMLVQGTGGLIQNLFALVSFIPNLAVSVRRLHDQDRSGWLLLLVFVPVLGWFALLVFMCLEGTRGANRFGPDPKNPTDLEAF
jgi:uncharacterized membrane protein YhaH (DUF805 family)